MAQQNQVKSLVNKNYRINIVKKPQRCTTPTAQFQLRKVPEIPTTLHHDNSPFKFRLSSDILPQARNVSAWKSYKKSSYFPRTIRRRRLHVKCPFSWIFQSVFSRKPSVGWGVVVAMQQWHRVCSRTFSEFNKLIWNRKLRPKLSLYPQILLQILRNYIQVLNTAPSAGIWHVLN